MLFSVARALSLSLLKFSRAHGNGVTPLHVLINEPRVPRRPLTRPSSAPLIPLHQFSITKKSLCFAAAVIADPFSAAYSSIYIYSSSYIYIYISSFVSFFTYTHSSPVSTHENLSARVTEIVYYSFLSTRVSYLWESFDSLLRLTLFTLNIDI